MNINLNMQNGFKAINEKNEKNRCRWEKKAEKENEKNKKFL